MLLLKAGTRLNTRCSRLKHHFAKQLRFLSENIVSVSMLPYSENLVSISDVYASLKGRTWLDDDGNGASLAPHQKVAASAVNVVVSCGLERSSLGARQTDSAETISRTTRYVDLWICLLINFTTFRQCCSRGGFQPVECVIVMIAQWL